jgi:3-dehydroquinate synthetase
MIGVYKQPTKVITDVATLQTLPQVDFASGVAEVIQHGLKAGVGAGAWSDVASACEACIKITGSAQPNPSEVEAYRKSYAVYQELYPALKSSFVKM